MSTQDEKKPPVGGVVDYRLLGQRHRVMGRILAAREALQTAEFIAYDARLAGAGDAVGAFVNRELDALIRDVLKLLEAVPATPAPPAGSAGFHPASLPGQSPQG